MKNKSKPLLTAAKLLSLLLAMCICLQITAPVFAADQETEAPLARVLAVSDIQAATGDSGNTRIMRILDRAAVRLGFTNVDSYILAGDYSATSPSKLTAEDTSASIANIKNTIVGDIPEVENSILFVKGNHDIEGAEGLTDSGAHEYEYYSTYVINESDFMWNQGTVAGGEDRVKATAAALEKYLARRAAAGDSRPVFVVSHLPLHYTMRTYLNTDNLYARYIFDVLNAAGEKGLNIIFIYGHNHTNGWDSYLGGSCVYLAKGDGIYIGSPADHSVFTEEKLSFTYLNAGYAGTVEGSKNGDKALSLTAYEIYADRVEISRIAQNGKIHSLKCAGGWNTAKPEQATLESLGFLPDERVVESAAVMSLTTVKEEYLASPGDVNSDGQVIGVDILFIKRAIVGMNELSEAQRAAADVNGDGKINAGDILMIKRAIAGLIKLGKVG